MGKMRVFGRLGVMSREEVEVVLTYRAEYLCDVNGAMRAFES